MPCLSCKRSRRSPSSSHPIAMIPVLPGTHPSIARPDPEPTPTLERCRPTSRDATGRPLRETEGRRHHLRNPAARLSDRVRRGNRSPQRHPSRLQLLPYDEDLPIDGNPVLVVERSRVFPEFLRERAHDDASSASPWHSGSKWSGKSRYNSMCRSCRDLVSSCSFSHSARFQGSESRASRCDTDNRFHACNNRTKKRNSLHRSVWKAVPG